LINRLLHPPSVNLTVSGGATGTMTDLSNWHGFGTSCSIENGRTFWLGAFSGTIGSDHMVFMLIITPYHGPGSYVDEPYDPQSRTLLPARVLLSTIPESAPGGVIPPAGGRAYRTEPAGPYQPRSAVDAARQGPVGQATVSLNPDEKSGKVDAVLVNWAATADTPVRINGSFNCGVLSNRQ
jgi:hypothetical protein